MSRLACKNTLFMSVYYNETTIVVSTAIKTVTPAVQLIVTVIRLVIMTRTVIVHSDYGDDHSRYHILSFVSENAELAHAAASNKTGHMFFDVMAECHPVAARCQTAVCCIHIKLATCLHPCRCHLLGSPTEPCDQRWHVVAAKK